MGSITTTADMESPKRYRCCCICYFCDADYIDCDNFMFKYEDVQKFAYAVEFYEYQYGQEQ